MGQILDLIRLGGNVVWQVSSIDEFRLFAEPFARQTVETPGLWLWQGAVSGRAVCGWE